MLTDVQTPFPGTPGLPLIVVIVVIVVIMIIVILVCSNNNTSSSNNNDIIIISSSSSSSGRGTSLIVLAGATLARPYRVSRGRRNAFRIKYEFDAFHLSLAHLFMRCNPLNLDKPGGSKFVFPVSSSLYICLGQVGSG